MTAHGPAIETVNIGGGEWCAVSELEKRVQLPPGSALIRVGPTGWNRSAHPIIVSWRSADGVPRHAVEWGDGRWHPGFLTSIKGGCENFCASLQVAVDAAERFRSEDFAEMQGPKPNPWPNAELGALCRVVAEVWAAMGGEPRAVGVGFGPGGYLLSGPRRPRDTVAEVADALASHGHVFDHVPPAIRVCTARAKSAGSRGAS